MSTSFGIARLRRFHAPLGMLLLLLQRTPVLRVLLPGAEYALSVSAGHVLKCAFGLAAMGAFDTLAGATTFTVISASGTATGAAKSTFQIGGTVGTPINGAGSVTFSVSGAPGTPKSFGVTDNASGLNYNSTLPPGLAVNPVTGTTSGGAPYYNTATKLSINGTPTTAGTYTVRFWASDSTAIAGGNSAYVIATFTIAAGSGGTNVAPAITTHPASQTVTAGSAVSFTVAASGTPTPTFQWQKGGVNISGATGTTYSIASAAAGDAGNYAVIATNSAGSATSNVATLTVNAANTAPAFATNPSSQSVTAGTAVTFSALATGNPTPTYQWQKDGANIAGATSATYALASVQTGDAGTYTVVATNIAGSATSSPAVLAVAPLLSAPVIYAQPTSVVVTAGNAASFSVGASGNPAPTYQWKFGGTNISGATAATYSLANAQAGNAGSYTVVVTNSQGSVTSSAATLTVNPAPVAPTISTQPASVAVNAGTSATFSVTATGVPAPSYQWRKAGVAISGATAATYTISSAQSADAGSYTVLVTNSAGSVTSNAATLTVNVAPAITSQPVSLTVLPSASASFSVAATGTPTPTYQWKKGGVNVTGATAATYTITSAQSADAGSYTVTVTNSAGSVTSTAATLTVSSVVVAPTIVTPPQSQSITAGNSLSLSVIAAGTSPFTYQWKKGGVTIAGATSSSYTVANATTGNAGSYTVVVTNSAGSATSAAATITVNVLPSFSTQPANATVTEGGAVSFSATATGTPTPTLQWQKNGVNLTGATTANYTIVAAGLSDAGSYTLVATNAAGVVSSSPAVLVVNAAVPVAPTIVTAPVGVTISAGWGAGFSVTASGTATLTYQWQKNGANIPGANGASYLISTTQAADAGSYRVVVANAIGSVTSAAAPLVVIPAASGARCDFNGDAKTDIVWLNSRTGERAIWLMDGTNFLSSSTLGFFPLEWTIVATGDFNADGKTDLVWSNAISGERAIWLMNGTNFLSSQTLGVFPLEWTVAATGDFNGDGKPDLVWSNSVTGERALWLMNGTNFLSASTLGIFPGEWTVAATGDFNGDAKPDIVWSNSVTGERAIWLMNGTGFLASSTLGIFPLEWTVAGVGYFNGDGKPDLIWSNGITGERAVWLMNGTNFQSSATLGLFPLEWTAKD